MNIVVVGLDNDMDLFDKLNIINHAYGLNLSLSFKILSKVTDKHLLLLDNTTPIIALIKKIPYLIKIDNNAIIKSSLNWQSLTHRIVNAGRKSELLLQACKSNQGQYIIDGTAGFGHDALLLASTGADVAMVEKHPVIALLLHYEYQLMLSNKNWLKLLSRIYIYYGDFINTINKLNKADIIYLDPMFPNNSYTAKVNKNMQLLHDIASPPTIDDEKFLFNCAINNIHDNGKLIIKRPINTPFLANKTPVQSYSNDAIRFDKYLS